MTALPRGRVQVVAERVHAPEAEAAEPVEVAYGGFVTRTLAFAIDAVLIDVGALAFTGLVALVLSIFPVSHGTRNVLAVVGGALFVLWVITYFTTFWITTGQTPGSRVMQIRVVRTEGRTLRPRHALVRLVGMLISLPLFWGYLPILVTDRRRGVFDAMAGTVVVTTTPEGD